VVLDQSIAARLAQARGETVPAEKNPVGRPPKQARVDRDAQSSAVRVDLGKVTIPSSSTTSKSSRMFDFSSLSSPSSASALLQHIPEPLRKRKTQPSVSLKVIPD